MARPIAGDPPVGQSPAPFQTPPTGLPVPAAPASPFSYTNQPSMPAPAVPTAPTPSGLLNAFRRRWVLGTFIGGLVAAAVAIGAWMVAPSGKHQARALVQLRPRSVSFITKDRDDFAEYRNRQKFLLKNRDLITGVLKEPAVSSLDSVKGAVRAGDDPVQMIEEQLKVTVATDDMLEVTMTGNNLDDMKVILEHLVKRYVDDATAFERRQLEDQIKKNEQYAEGLRVEIENTEKAIELIGKANSTTGGEDNATRLALLQRQLFEAEAEYNRLKRVIDGLESELTVLKKQLDDKNPKNAPDPVLVARAVNNDPRVVKAKTAFDAAKTTYDRAWEISGENPTVPVVIERKAELDKAKKEHEDAKRDATTEAVEVARAYEGALRKTQLAELEKQIEVKKLDLDKERTKRDGVKKAIDQGVTGGLSIEGMRKSLQPQKDTLDKVNTLLAQQRLERNQDGRASIRGDVDKIPFTNQNKKLFLSSAGGLFSFFVVVLVVAFLEWRTRRVDGVDQVVNELGMRVIGTVPAFPNRANLRAAVEAGGANWRFVLNESINSTRTMLLHTARTQSMQVVMVTSATQGEGKTSLASQLATSMATAGMRTLIVDCDLRNPSIQKLFELPLGPGVSEVLRQEVDVSDVVQATAVPNLWIIPAGQCSNTTIAALAQGHPMETLFNRLRGQFDFIIVDSCPVLPVADALLIGQHVDGVIFSIMQDISQLPKVMTASEKLNQLNIPLVGAVVNGIKQDVYSYGYNYVKQLPA
jgi:capsular exopolysaccharide synthesis family protein